MPELTLLDTGPLVALSNRRDSSHAWAVSKLTTLRGPLLSCGAAMAESGFVLRNHPVALSRLRELLTREAVRSIEETTALWKRSFELMEHYANVPMSFADACLVAMAELLPQARIFTLDRDFLIYRNGDKPLALIAPFGT